jgi:hypothetical protein
MNNQQDSNIGPERKDSDDQDAKTLYQSIQDYIDFEDKEVDRKVSRFLEKKRKESKSRRVGYKGGEIDER